MKQMNPILTPCSTCNGTGQVALAASQVELLGRFKKGQRMSVRAVHALQPGGTVNALNNRLEKLRSHGLLIRERDGREFLYSLAPKKKE